MGLVFSSAKAMTWREKRLADADYLREERGEKSLENWAFALGLHPAHCGVSGYLVLMRSEEEMWQQQEEAGAVLKAQWERDKAACQWLTQQIQTGKGFTTQELAARLGAEDEVTARAMLEALAFDLFHLNRQLWRELKRQEAQEAGLTFDEVEASVKREERRLKRLEARPTVRPAPARLKRPRPIEYRPEVQPTAPTN